MSASRAVSRSDRRDRADPAKERGAARRLGGRPSAAPRTSPTATRATSPGRCSPSSASAPDQFGCLDSLYTRETNWRVDADNPSSSAYGIPQALPGSKMATAGADWATNPVTQIRWGLGYIQDRYGSPVRRLGAQQSQRLVLT